MAIPRELAFDIGEYRTRLHAVRRRMAERDLDGLVLFGPHNIYYLSGMDSENVFGSQALVVSLTDDPVLVLSHFEAGRAANTCWLSDVETYPGPNAVADGPPPRPWRFDGGPTSLAAATAGAVARLGLADGRLGVERAPGWSDGGTLAELERLLPSARVADPFGVVEEVRLRKSPAELALIRRAAELTEIGMAAGREAIREDVPDSVVLAEIYAAMFRAGCELMCWGPVVAAGYRAASPHCSVNGRRIQRGETVFLELTGQVRRYIAPLMRTVVVGEPSAEIARTAVAVEAALGAILETAKPGVAASAVFRAATEALDPVLDPSYFHGGAGYSVGIGYPLDWREQLGFYLVHDNPRPLEAGMVFHLPISVRRYGEWGVCLSHTIHITETGAVSITTSPATLAMVA